MVVFALAVWAQGILVVAVVVLTIIAGYALQAARRIRQAAEEAALIEEHLECALVRTDAGGRIVGWNPSAARLFGYLAEEMLDSAVDLLDMGEGAGLRAGLEHARDHGHWSGELVARRKDGGRVHTRSVIISLNGDGGRLRQQVGMHFDITRLRREEEDGRRLAEQLLQSQKHEAVGQLAGGLAHDFNNLLTSILGYAEMLGRHLQPDSEEAADLEELHRSGKRAADLTRQLLGLSRTGAGRVLAFDLSALVENLAKLLIPSVGESIALTVEVDHRPTWIQADRTELEQVLIHLALNARDAMPLGGSLRLRTERVGDRVALSVSDSGKGMSADTLDRVFEPFFTTKEPGRGTGLGLSSVRTMVERCGGQIEAESTPGAGSTFRVTFPAVDADTLDPPPIPGTRPSSDTTTTVLVVEDEPLVRRLVCSGLRESGYVVLEADSGAEARRLSEAHNGPIELLVTDVVMPAQGGVEVAQSIVATRPEMRVLYMSGYTEEAIVLHGVPVDGSSFLQKPFTPALLQARIEMLLQQDDSNAWRGA
ncbi:MAG: ATP-binding protein [Planctomycetota bacterium]|nr:ATP-binding protein [Planctomycetota bacterium]